MKKIYVTFCRYKNIKNVTQLIDIKNLYSKCPKNQSDTDVLI